MPHRPRAPFRRAPPSCADLAPLDRVDPAGEKPADHGSVVGQSANRRSPAITSIHFTSRASSARPSRLGSAVSRRRAIMRFRTLGTVVRQSRPRVAGGVLRCWLWAGTGEPSPSCKGGWARRQTFSFGMPPRARRFGSRLRRRRSCTGRQARPRGRGKPLESTRSPRLDGTLTRPPERFRS